MNVRSQREKDKVQELRAIDDIFFQVLGKDIPTCQEMLRVILEDPELVVISSVTQQCESNIYGRAVVLDALCRLGNGSNCNIEIQRANNDDHLRRARYHASIITVKESEPGTDFKNIPEVYIVYISEFDPFNAGKTTYHVEKVLKETGKTVDDGLHEIFVNTVGQDGTDIAELMACFKQKEVHNPKFPALSAEVTRLKETEGGINEVCEVMEQYIKEEIVERVKLMISDGKSKEEILKYFSEEEYAAAEAELLQPV